MTTKKAIKRYIDQHNAAADKLNNEFAQIKRDLATLESQEWTRESLQLVYQYWDNLIDRKGELLAEMRELNNKYNSWHFETYGWAALSV